MSNVLRLKKELFEIQFINETITAFSHIASIDIEEGGDYWICSFSNTRVSCERIILEFENYLISLINQKGMTYVSV